jgi:hypothetical protein
VCAARGARPLPSGLKRLRQLTRAPRSSPCSGLIKLAYDYSDLWAGHSSWFVYAAMGRIYKHYTFNVNNPNVASKSLSFSSYPGALTTLDCRCVGRVPAHTSCWQLSDTPSEPLCVRWSQASWRASTTSTSCPTAWSWCRLPTAFVRERSLADAAAHGRRARAGAAVNQSLYDLVKPQSLFAWQRVRVANL